MRQHHVSQESGKVIKHTIRIPIANTQNTHIAVIALIPQCRSKHLDVGESHAEYPDAQEDFTSFLLACVSHALMMGMKRYRPTSMYTYHRGVVS